MVVKVLAKVRRMLGTGEIFPKSCLPQKNNGKFIAKGDTTKSGLL